MARQLAEWIAGLAGGRAWLLGTTRLPWVELQALLASDFTLVSCAFPLSVGLGGFEDAAVRALADAAAAVWPDWSLAGDGEPDGASRAWAVLARHGIEEGRGPLVYGVPSRLQAAELARAIDPGGLVLFLEVQGAAEPDPRLYSLSRAAEWLASSSSARVIVTVPPSLFGVSHLESIAHAGLCLDGTGQPLDVRVARRRNRAHHTSSVEQLLLDVLTRDDELGPLFQANRPFHTVRGRRRVLDLFWEEGRLVVELDGFETHGSRQAFADDRTRDYEVQLSGLRVLRLTNDELQEDPARELEKIRDMVRLCRRELAKRGGANGQG